MKRKLHYILTRIFDTPLMIQQQKFDTILSVLRPRLPMMFDDGGWDEPVETGVSDPTASPVDVTGRVAVIPIHGVLVHRATGMEAMCGMTDYQVLSNLVTEAANSEEVDAILLDVDSPGGEAAGCFEFTDLVYEARAKKPIIGIGNELACSAAYSILSACSKVYLTKTALLGSIGVIATHVDVSKADEMAGYKYTNIFAGKKKADWTEHEPLSARGREAIQSQVSSMYSIFVSTVARNRGLDPETVAGTEAGLYIGKSAVVAGLADEVIPLSALSEKIQEAISMKKAKVLTGAPAASAAQPNTPKLVASSTGPATEGDPTETPNPVVDDPEESEDEDNEDDSDTPTPTKPPTPVASSPVDRANVHAEIASMCAIAGAPQLAAGFIRNGLTLDQAKAQLFDKLAAGEVRLTSAVDPLSSATSEGGEMLAAAMRELNDETTARRKR